MKEKSSKLSSKNLIDLIHDVSTNKRSIQSDKVLNNEIINQHNLEKMYT